MKFSLPLLAGRGWWPAVPPQMPPCELGRLIQPPAAADAAAVYLRGGATTARGKYRLHALLSQPSEVSSPPQPNTVMEATAAAPDHTGRGGGHTARCTGRKAPAAEYRPRRPR